MPGVGEVWVGVCKNAIYECSWTVGWSVSSPSFCCTWAWGGELEGSRGRERQRERRRGRERRRKRRKKREREGRRKKRPAMST